MTKLVVQTREKTGTAEARRLRKRGLVPGNIYGHGGDPVGISVPAEVFTPLVFSGQRVLEADFGDRTQLAILRDLQWDTFGTKILHFDLLRVDRDERVTMEVPIEFRGMSPGVLDGGVLDQHLHSLAIEGATFAIPNQIEVRIGTLNIGDAIHVRDIVLPEGTDLMNPPDDVVVQVNAPRVELEEEDADVAAAHAEPEVIGRDKDDEDGD